MENVDNNECCTPVEDEGVEETLEQPNVKRVFRYGTGQEIPGGAKYLWSCKNGSMPGEAGKPIGYEFVWHYYEVA